MEGKVLELFGDGKQRRDLNYVDDVVEALLLAGASEATDGEIFNLGAPEPVSVAELAEELISLTGRGQIRAVPFPTERQLIDIGNFYSSYAKIERVIGWQPRTSLRTGLALTIEYYKKYGQHYLEPHDHFVSRSR
jgi:UDP-glucose 4-epimerase